MSDRSASQILYRLALLYRSTVDLVQKIRQVLPTVVAYSTSYIWLVHFLCRVRDLKARILDSIYEIQPSLIPPHVVRRSRA